MVVCHLVHPGISCRHAILRPKQRGKKPYSLTILHLMEALLCGRLSLSVLAYMEPTSEPPARYQRFRAFPGVGECIAGRLELDRKQVQATRCFSKLFRHLGAGRQSFLRFRVRNCAVLTEIRHVNRRRSVDDPLPPSGHASSSSSMWPADIKAYPLKSHHLCNGLPGQSDRNDRARAIPPIFTVQSSMFSARSSAHPFVTSYRRRRREWPIAFLPDWHIL